jgi:formylglycine-generating enzyme required for sulfatase activity/TolB-like protein
MGWDLSLRFFSEAKNVHVKRYGWCRLGPMTGLNLRILLVLAFFWAGTAEAGETVRVAVLELRGPLPNEQLGLLSDEVRAGALDVARPRGLIVMSRENIAILLKDMGKDCAQAEGECEVETGRNLQAAYVLSGQVVQMGPGYICTLKLFDTSSAALLASDRVRGATPDGLLDGLRPLADRLMAQGLGGVSPTIAKQAVPSPIVQGIVTETGETEVVVGQDADFAALAKQAANAKAKREQREAEIAVEQTRLEAVRLAEEKRLAEGRRAEAKRLAEKRHLEAEALALERAQLVEEERRAREALLEAQRKRIAEARERLLSQAKKDFAAISPLLEMEVTEETRPVLSAYQKKYDNVEIRVDQEVERVTVPGLVEVRRALGVGRHQNSIGMNFVRIEPGKFKMGSPSSETGRQDDELLHEVVLSQPYVLQTTEVTQRQWREVMGANPSHESHERVSLIGDNLPVQGMSWYEAVKFANALSEKEKLSPAYKIRGESVTWKRNAEGYRLPTEAEWDYAARAETVGLFAGAEHYQSVCRVGNVSDRDAQSKFGWSDHWSKECRDGHAGPAPVGSYEPNAWGLYDMTGNVWEWCWDYYGQYAEDEDPDPVAIKNPSGPPFGRSRIIRGGSWTFKAADCRISNRSAGRAQGNLNDLGFRLARTILAPRE